MDTKKTILLTIVTVIIIAASILAFFLYEKSANEKFDALLQSDKKVFDAPYVPVVSRIPNPPGENYEGDSEAAARKFSASPTQPYKNVQILGTGIKAASAKTFIVAFVGDQGLADSAHRVLKLAKSEGADAITLLGDYDYTDNPKAWMQLIEGELGTDFPVIPVIGNHDEKKWTEYSALLAQHLKKTPSVNCQGELGVKATCTFNALRVFTVAPGIDSISISRAEYARYIASSSEKISDAFWNVCAWHKNQTKMQVGDKVDEAGWDTYNTCLKLGFPIMTAHEHSYSRSFLLGNMQTPEIANKDLVTLATSSWITSPIQIDHLSLAPGKTFVAVSGLGGKSIRPQIQNNPWWSSVYTSNQMAKSGALFCAFRYLGNDNNALCYFKNTDGEIVDAFEMSR